MLCDVFWGSSGAQWCLHGRFKRISSCHCEKCRYEWPLGVLFPRFLCGALNSCLVCLSWRCASVIEPIKHLAPVKLSASPWLTDSWPSLQFVTSTAAEMNFCCTNEQQKSPHKPSGLYHQRNDLSWWIHLWKIWKTSSFAATSSALMWTTTWDDPGLLSDRWRRAPIGT